MAVLRQVLVFDEAGQRVGAPQAVSGCFVCSLDIHAASDLLLVGGEQSPPSDSRNREIKPTHGICTCVLACGIAHGMA